MIINFLVGRKYGLSFAVMTTLLASFHWVERQTAKMGQCIAHTTKHFLSISKTSTVTETMNVLSSEYVF
jgi:hypothetical protein